MPKANKGTVQDDELAAMAQVYSALKDLGADAQQRVLDYVTGRLALRTEHQGTGAKNYKDSNADRFQDESSNSTNAKDASEKQRDDSLAEQEKGDGIEGVSPVAKKWMRRNGLSESQLSRLFSLGIDEIDLVAKSLPGKTKGQKFRNLVLLEGVASYLGSGVARIDNKKLKQAATHYGADPGKNLWNYMQRLAAEASGSTASGFTLTSRGLVSATELIKEMASKK